MYQKKSNTGIIIFKLTYISKITRISLRYVLKSLVAKFDKKFQKKCNLSHVIPIGGLSLNYLKSFQQLLGDNS